MILFAPEKATEALTALKYRVRRFAESLRSRKIHASDVSTVISSALATDVLSDEKQALLKQFAKNDTVVEELASVLTMQLQSLQSWSWPQEGVLVEPRPPSEWQDALLPRRRDSHMPAPSLHRDELGGGV